MPTVQEHSLNYQPNTEPYSYTPFKISIFKKMFNLLKELLLFIVRSFTGTFKKLFSIKTLITETKFLLVIVTLFTILAIIIVVINYFNILSLSYLYPKYFGILPHRYDIAANNAALSGARYYAFTKSYEIDAKLKTVKKDSILVEYNGKYVELFLSPSLHCDINFTKKNKDNKDEIFFKPTICSDVLTNQNLGKKVNLVFNRNSDGYNVVNYFNIE